MSGPHILSIAHRASQASFLRLSPYESMTRILKYLGMVKVVRCLLEDIALNLVCACVNNHCVQRYAFASVMRQLCQSSPWGNHRSTALGAPKTLHSLPRLLKSRIQIWRCSDGCRSNLAELGLALADARPSFRFGTIWSRSSQMLATPRPNLRCSQISTSLRRDQHRPRPWGRFLGTSRRNRAKFGRSVGQAYAEYHHVWPRFDTHTAGRCSSGVGQA